MCKDGLIALSVKVVMGLVGMFAPLSASAHGAGDVYGQYSRLAPALAKELMELDHKRTAREVRAFESANSADSDKKQAILSQFGLTGSGPQSFEQIYIKHTLWPGGHLFRVCFFDGDVVARKHILDLFAEIIAPTSLRLDRTNRNCPDTKADIQIQFANSGCFSYYGQDALRVIESNPNLPTMALCFKSGPTWSEYDNGTIRHEIMHALGAAHEHQHPESTCKAEFNLEAFRNPPLFDPDPAKNEAAITVNIREITTSYSSEDLKIIDYDPKSIMHYRLDARFFKTGGDAKCALRQANNVLSEGDWAFLRRMYPKN